MRNEHLNLLKNKVAILITSLSITIYTITRNEYQNKLKCSEEVTVTSTLVLILPMLRTSRKKI